MLSMAPRIGTQNDVARRARACTPGGGYRRIIEGCSGAFPCDFLRDTLEGCWKPSGVPFGGTTSSRPTSRRRAPCVAKPRHGSPIETPQFRNRLLASSPPSGTVAPCSPYVLMANQSLSQIGVHTNWPLASSALTSGRCRCGRRPRRGRGL